MIQKITGLLQVHFYTVFIIGIIVIGFLALGIMLRRIKDSIIPLSLTIITIAGFIFAVYNRYKYAGKIEFYLGIYLVIAFIFNFVVYLIKFIKMNKYYKIVESSSYIESSILVYLDSKGRVILYTEEFLELFNVSKAKELHEAIRYIHLGEKQLSLNTYIKLLADEKEEDFNLIIDLANSKEIKLALSKRKIINKGELLGYVITTQKVKTVTNESSNTSFENAIHLVSEAAAIYESENNKFVLNKKMQALLGVEEVTNFDDFVFFEDRKQLEKRAKVDGEKSKLIYRINATNSTKVWVLENTKIENGKLTKIIKETDFRSLIYNFRDYSKLEFELDQLLMTQNNFALAIIQLDSLSQIKEKIGKEATLVIATQFFGSLNNEIKDLKVYEIGYYKYAFFIKNDEVYNNILRDLHNNSSLLLKTKVNFNDMIFDIKSYLGIVERKNVGNASTEVMINLAEDALKLALNKNYSKDYSIYFSKKKQLEAEVQNIDLSDDFLDKILK